MDCDSPGSYGILQAKKLEWVAIPFFKESSWPGIKPRSPALQTNSLSSEPPGKPIGFYFHWVYPCYWASWGHKELDTTEWAHISMLLHFHCLNAWGVRSWIQLDLWAQTCQAGFYLTTVKSWGPYKCLQSYIIYLPPNPHHLPIPLTPPTSALTLVLSVSKYLLFRQASHYTSRIPPLLCPFLDRSVPHYMSSYCFYFPKTFVQLSMCSKGTFEQPYRWPPHQNSLPTVQLLFSHNSYYHWYIKHY